MRKVIALLLILVFTFIPNIGSVSFDATPPNLENCKVTPTVLPESGGELTFTAHINSVNGLDRTPIVRVMNSNSTRWIADVVSLKLVSGDSKSGDYEGKALVAGNLAPDRYYVQFDPLWDVVLNRTSFITCSNAFVDYAGYQAPKPTPIPTPTPTVTPSSKLTPTPSTTIYLSNPADKSLSILIENLKTQISLLNTKILKICNVKPKPKGC